LEKFMPATYNPFAKVTEAHRLASQKLNPCAFHLWMWLLALAPAGKPAEVHLKDFYAENQGRFDGRGYTMAWIKKSLNKLIEEGFVDIVFKYSGKVFKLITWHPDQQSAQDLNNSSKASDKNRSNLNQSFNFSPSNADSVAVSYREKRETTDKPTHHPVSTDEQGRLIDSQPTSKNTAPETESPIEQPSEPPIEPSIIQQIETAGFKLNKTLGSIVRQATPQVIQTAIDATQQYLTQLQKRQQPLKRQPEAVLVTAIREQWESKHKEANTIPPEFNDWFNLARSVDIAQASSIQAEVTKHPPGVLCVLSPSGIWEPFDQMRGAYSLKRLQKLKEERDQLMAFKAPFIGRVDSFWAKDEPMQI
jgi:hypothetical protein